MNWRQDEEPLTFFEHNEYREQLCALLEGLEAPPEFWMTQPPFILKKLGEEIAKAAKSNKP